MYNNSNGPEPGVKLSVYVPRELAQRIRDEAGRQRRSLSFVLCWAWRVAEGRLNKTPACPLEAKD